MNSGLAVEEELDSGALEIAMANREDRAEIYRQRFQVYANELGQHAFNKEESISDPIDDYNHYLVVKRDKKIVGFVSITPQGSPRLSIDKYLEREQFHELPWESLSEIRLLTVLPSERQGPVTGLLLYAAALWLQQNNAGPCIAMGRQEIMRLYRRLGFAPLGMTIPSGKVHFELMMIDQNAIEKAIRRFERVKQRIEQNVLWNLDLLRTDEAKCYHGGASIESMACEPDKVAAQQSVINADVLDAWFPPSPKVTQAMAEHLPWLARTSPPVVAHDLEKAIAQQRGLDKRSVVAGAGSSDLIFRAFQAWLSKSSHVLLVTPCYGEYKYICQHVIGCQVDELETSVDTGFQLEPEQLVDRLVETLYDLVVIVNPNNPTGAFWTQEMWLQVLDRIPDGTRVWIDECYVDFVDSNQSMEQTAAESTQLIVCKSLSKCLALSGLRVGYLTLPEKIADGIRRVTPPWIVGTLGQLAAVAALLDLEYYQHRYQETHQQREWLEAALTDIGLEVVPGKANFSLVYLPVGFDKEKFLSHCRANQLFIRDMFPTSPELGDHAIRVATKSSADNRQMVQVIQRALLESRRSF